jgi:hypothetical protein
LIDNGGVGAITSVPGQRACIVEVNNGDGKSLVDKFHILCAVCMVKGFANGKKDP